MSKLLDTVGAASITPTSIEGLFVRNVSLKDIEELQKVGEDDDGLAGLMVIFRDFAVDKDGERFEDVQTAEQIKALPMETVGNIARAVTEVVERLGKGLPAQDADS